jgi:hypothetical protein
MARSGEDVSLAELVVRLGREPQTRMRQELRLVTLELTRPVEGIAQAIDRVPRTAGGR